MSVQAGVAEDTLKETLERAGAVQKWLLGEARFIDDPDTATAGFAQHLIDAGLPLDRMSSAMPTLHAVRRGLGRTWLRDSGVEALDFPWGTRRSTRQAPTIKPTEPASG